MEIKFENFISPNEWKIYGHTQEICNLRNKIIRRIGSASTRGIVFDIVLDGIHHACKILLDTETNPDDKNRREISISTMLGERYPDLFPVVYGYGRCLSITIPVEIAPQNIMNEAFIWYIRTQILNNAGISKYIQKSLELKYRNSGLDSEVYLNFLREKNISIPNKFPALMMISELGFGDLSQWAREDHTADEWRSVIFYVIQGIKALSMENITHNDLHFGNILIMMDGKVKIFDFGETETYYRPEADLSKFLDGFRYYPNIPRSVQQLVQTLIMNMNKPLDEILTLII
ncbi:Hypothetical protein HVR_LOCUS969 [uncultured virus]|nr:Hypothetical protein HVR_LOCUS969 [uncultured virus]